MGAAVTLLIAAIILAAAPISLWQQTIISEADGLLRSGNLAAAIDLLEDFVRKIPAMPTLIRCSQMLSAGNQSAQSHI